MRLGLFGGTFDPVHLGHLLMAEQCREQCALDQLWFVPAAVPPHKQGREITPGKARAEMLEVAIAGCRDFAVSRMELDRGGTTFTVDTLQHLHDEDPSCELFFLLGADSLADLPTWREPARIAQLATIVAVNRGDRPLPESATLKTMLGEEIALRVQLVTMPGIDLSASDTRRRVREGRSIRFMVPRAVEVYIHEHQLYRET
jgi:nicotinate-nucleotide adenylyltransferase